MQGTLNKQIYGYTVKFKPPTGSNWLLFSVTIQILLYRKHSFIHVTIFKLKQNQNPT